MHRKAEDGLNQARSQPTMPECQLHFRGGRPNPSFWGQSPFRSFSFSPLPFYPLPCPPRSGLQVQLSLGSAVSFDPQWGRRRLSHKPGSRLPLLSTRPAVTFPAKGIIRLGRYQIILLGDRVACPIPLCNGAQPGLEPATCESEVHCPANRATKSPT